MEQPKVSVVVPIYNVESYLDRCIESVVSQTYGNLEILLVDDGSLDNCPEMCEEWAQKDSRIKVIHKANAGLGMARNTGIENATGTYIFFFDSDDYVDLTTVEKCVASAQKNSAEVVLFGSANAYEDGRVEKNPITHGKTVFTQHDIRNNLLPGLFTYQMGFGGSCCMKMFSLDVIHRENLRFVSERELISEDAFFVLEYFSKIRVASVVEENLYFYCKRSDSLTTTYRKDRQSKNAVFLSTALKFVDNRQLPAHTKDHITARYHMYTIAALKHISRSDLSAREKKQETQAILRDPVLHTSLGGNVLKLHKKTLRVFFTLLKIKAYPLCKLMLSLKG